ncbi:OmpA family protein [Schaalia sp. 19OD2882]|nr:OmpA family protein [Schaalia sp. 19OD2882]
MAAALALTTLICAPAAHASPNPAPAVSAPPAPPAAPATPSLDFGEPEQLEFPAPLVLEFPVETEDRAATTVELEKATTTLSGDVNFEVDSDQLTPRAKQILDSLAAQWAQAAPSSVTITGHTDDVADDAHNLDLSKRRARTVGNHLKSKVPSLKVATDGKGEAQPLVPNDSEEARAKNRRVEIRAEE